MKRIIVMFFVAAIASAFVTHSGNGAYFTIPEFWPKPEYNFSKNPLSQEKIQLGRALFYDPLLSADNTISCSSCHSQYNAFAHSDHKLSHGIADQIGTRNAPALQNLAWRSSFMWDGSAHHLDAQALAPLTNPIEMNETIEHIVAKLQRSNKYPKAFYAAFGDSIVTGQRTLQALSQFMVTLVSSNSKYDKVMRKEKGIAFSESESKGYLLFKENCASCHKEPLFTNDRFESNGLQPDSLLKDIGRMKITGNQKDSLLFKVPSLRNVEVSYPYMHDGRFANLQMVLFHYTNGIHQSKTLPKQLRKKMNLCEDDKRNLINFIKTLTDEEFLRNKDHSYPKEFLLK
ncbi:cytochrome c peroxidase [Flavobacterium sp. DGU11]|uniref:Cytochrome c peroxidase n=1 Tax=Flavobacterium arundinis TaxID=3139143 RepID=A0ABU9HX78_9FLAO